MAKKSKKRTAKRNKDTRIGLLKVRRGAGRAAKTFWESNFSSAGKLKSPYGDNYEDRTPYRTDAITRDAIFEGRDGSFTRYFSAPRGMQVDMTSDASDNQLPLLDMVRAFAEDLNAQPISSINRAVTRGFHLQMTRRDMKSGVPYSRGTTKSQADYLDRCNTNRPLANYTLNAGFRLELINTRGDQLSVPDIIREGAKESLYKSDSVREQMLQRYMQDSKRVEEIVTDSGFEPIDFADPNQNKNDKKLHDITSWMCNDGMFLENSSLSFPLYGTSAILPRFDEVSFYLVKHNHRDRRGGQYYSPSAYKMRYAREFFRPENAVVHVSIRGEILSMKHTQQELKIGEDSAFAEEMESRSQEEIRLSMIREAGEKRDVATSAQISSRFNPMIVDSYVIIGVRSYPGEVPPVVTRLQSSEYNMEVIPITGNIDDAIHATLPGFNKPLFTNGRKRPWSFKHKDAVQRVFPGMIFLNGIFNSSFPPVKKGIYSGLTNSFQEYKPFFIDPKQISEATSGENSPGILLTGRPDAGKTTLLKQYAKQLENNNQFCALFNFKSVDPIAPWWQETMKNGVVLNIDNRFLANNRGLMDAFNFYDRSTEMSDISNTISQAVFMLWRQNDSTTSDSKYRPVETSLSAAITDRVKNPYSQCTGDVIFGTATGSVLEEFEDVERNIRRQGGELQDIIREFGIIAEENKVTPPLPYLEVRTVIRDAIEGSSHPFWKAFVSLDGRANKDMANAVNSGSPLLFEWGEDFTPPVAGTTRENMNATEFDAIMSAMVSLGYVRKAVARHYRSTGDGGMVMIDEAAGALNIPQFESEVERMAREFRVVGTRLVIGTQRLTDVDEKIRSFISVYVIGAISASGSSEDTHKRTSDELALFYRITDTEPNDYELRKQFITTAGRSSEDTGGDIATRSTIRHPIPYAWIVDNINGVNSPALMGEFPIRELTGGMTKERKKAMAEELEMNSWERESDEEIIRRTMS